MGDATELPVEHATMKMGVNAVLAGCVLFKKRDIAVFAFDEAEKSGTTTFAVLIDSAWKDIVAEPAWTAIGLACALYPSSADWVIVASSSEGQLWELTPGTLAKRESEIGEDHTGITRLATIDDAVWACGMGRLVLKREVDGHWTDLSAPSAHVDEGVIGFTALAGSAEQGVVAVGWKGEIWYREHDEWHAEDSGTRANFNAVSFGPDGEVVVVGDDGAVVIGKRKQWTPLNSGVELNLHGVCHFGGEVFVCSDFELFRLEGGVLKVETRFSNEGGPDTCMNLIAGRESVFSQGERDIFRYSNGLWTRIH